MNALSKIRKMLTGTEKSNRWWDRPRRVNVVLEMDGKFDMSSHTQARAYRLTEDKLLVERDGQCLGRNAWKSYDRDRIVKADVALGETIIPEKNDNASNTNS